ncbi:hypothetical protein E2320_006321 [Naja naja]|nr:hypothetical protein E2320_006321 [Naja naja]
MIVRPGSVLEPDWPCTEEGRAYSGALLRRAQRRSFGLLERPVLAPQAAADVAAYKVFVSGKSGVGKSALVAKLAGLEVPLVHHETTGIQTSLVYWPAKLRESGKVLFFRFSFWDSVSRFDQFAHTDVTESDMLGFSHTWGLPILRAKSISERPSDGYAGLAEVAHVLNRLAEHLWRQDQVTAGLVPGEASPAVSEALAPQSPNSAARVSSCQ